MVYVNLGIIARVNGYSPSPSPSARARALVLGLELGIEAKPSAI